MQVSIVNGLKDNSFENKVLQQILENKEFSYTVKREFIKKLSQNKLPIIEKVDNITIIYESNYSEEYINYEIISKTLSSIARNFNFPKVFLSNNISILIYKLNSCTYAKIFLNSVDMAELLECYTKTTQEIILKKQKEQDVELQELKDFDYDVYIKDTAISTRNIDIKEHLLHTTNNPYGRDFRFCIGNNIDSLLFSHLKNKISDNAYKNKMKIYINALIVFFDLEDKSNLYKKKNKNVEPLIYDILEVLFFLENKSFSSFNLSHFSIFIENIDKIIKKAMNKETILDDECHTLNQSLKKIGIPSAFFINNKDKQSVLSKN